MNRLVPEYPEGCVEGSVCPLNQVQAGTAVRIKRLPAEAEVTTRLREMGFCEETEIRVLSRTCNLICQVCNARLGISNELGKTIMVEPLRPARELV